MIPRHELGTVSIHDELDAALLQIRVDLLIVYHLAQQVDPSTLVFLQCTVADFDRILYSVTEAEMTSQQDLKRPKVKYTRTQVLLAQIPGLTNFLDRARNARAIVCRDLELFDGS